MLLVLFWQLALTGNGPGNACSGVARLCWAAFRRVWLCVTGRLCSVVLGCVGLPSAAQLCKIVLRIVIAACDSTFLRMCPITLLWLAQALKGFLDCLLRGFQNLLRGLPYEIRWILKIIKGVL